MAITQTIVDAWKLEMWADYFGGATFKCALYGTAATLDQSLAGYTTEGEITGTGYTAGGVALVATPGYPLVENGIVYMDWVDPVWTGATFSARGALIYNSTTGTPVVTLDFGRVFEATGQNFTINFGSVLPVGALLRGQ